NLARESSADGADS
nr:Chain C, RNF146 [Homo sapiens]6CF6_D Chain D, RNF146 [Homo sapiens]